MEGRGEVGMEVRGEGEGVSEGWRGGLVGMEGRM